MARSKNPVDQILAQVGQNARSALATEAAKLGPHFADVVPLARSAAQALPSRPQLRPLAPLRPALASNPAPEPLATDDADDDVPAVFFETGDADYNLACAVGAYRITGDDDCIVATHPGSKIGFFGTEDQLAEFCATRNHRPQEWQVQGDPAEILAMEYERAGMQTVMRQMDDHDAAWEAAKKQYNDFHWGDKPGAVGLVTIPGVTGPAAFLGVARRIEYGAQKQGKWEEYFHVHGEESKTFPGIYGIGAPDEHGHYRAYAVFGGNMHIEDRGIID